MGKACNYAEFLRASGDMLSVLWTWIEEHNKVCPNKVDANKVKLFLELREIGFSCRKGFHLKLDPNEVKQKIATKLEKLNTSFNEHMQSKTDASAKLAKPTQLTDSELETGKL